MASWGNFIKQCKYACKQLKKDEYNNYEYINIIGLSQGGLIARYLVQKCDIKPKINTLVLIGTPNLGVEAIPRCPDEYIICQYLNGLADYYV